MDYKTYINSLADVLMVGDKLIYTTNDNDEEIIVLFNELGCKLHEYNINTEEYHMF